MRHAASYTGALLAALAVVVLPCRGQQSVEYSSGAESEFNNGLADFSAGKYRESVADFDGIIRDYPASQRISAAYIMKGKALLRLNENYETARTLKTFLAQFPASIYIADAEFMLGLVYQRIGRYEEATQEFVDAWQSLPPLPPARLRYEIIGAIDTTAGRYLAVATLERMRDGCGGGEQRAFLWLKIAEKQVAAGNLPAASVALDTLAARYPDSAFRDRINTLRSEVAGRSVVKIAALLPLMRNSEPSAMKEIGNDVYDGVMYAVEQFAHDPSARVKVGLETYDTQRDPVEAEKGAQTLGDEKEVIGAIGPVYSMEMPGAAIAANARGLPLVSPTANTNGIAAVGPRIFQANPDYEMRGRAMARYAVVSRGFKTVAVLAPNDTYARFLAESFINEVGRLGGKVVANEWYVRGTSDLKPQLENIRRAGVIEASAPSISFVGKLGAPDIMKLVDLGVPMKRIDSLMSKGSTISVAALLGPLPKSRIDSLLLPVVYDESKVDSLQYPVTGIQALYVPISSAEEIGVISSQVVYFNFQTQLLGSGEWMNFSELNANRRYCNGIQFESDTYIDSNSVSYGEFAGGFLARFKKLPSKNTLFGYDAATLMLSLIRDGATSRDALARALAGVRDFRGLHAHIGFSFGRVNTWLSVLQYRDDEIARLDEVSVDQTVPKARP